MKKSSSICGSVIILLLLLLLVVQLEGEERSTGKKTMVAEPARTCESQSHRFKGRCVSDNNCGLVCKNEGFTGGTCRGLRGRCFCTKTC